jgi:hypothetical protein
MEELLGYCYEINKVINQSMEINQHSPYLADQEIIDLSEIREHVQEVLASIDTLDEATMIIQLNHLRAVKRHLLERMMLRAA